MYRGSNSSTLSSQVRIHGKGRSFRTLYVDGTPISLLAVRVSSLELLLPRIFFFFYF